MRYEKGIDQLVSCVNVLILLVIALLYVVTGTGLGEDAVSALSNGTAYRGRANGSVAVECLVSWDAQSLPDMLDTLREENVQITFFVSGAWAKAHADTLLTMAEDGHEIGTLGYAPTLDGSANLVAHDIRASVSVIERITGKPVTCYCSDRRDRDVSARAADQTGLTHVYASSDLLTGRGEAADIVERACKTAFDGSIILLRPTAAAAEALPGILDAIRTGERKPTTVGRLLLI